VRETSIDDLSVIIPCHNERATIAALLDAAIHAPFPDKEIIVVDDCSIDGTRELLQGELASQIQKLVLHTVNQGKGAAALRWRPGISLLFRTPTSSTIRSNMQCCSYRFSKTKPMWFSGRASWVPSGLSENSTGAN